MTDEEKEELKRLKQEKKRLLKALDEISCVRGHWAGLSIHCILDGVRDIK